MHQPCSTTALLINTAVNIEKTRAWTKPTKISKAIKGNEAKTGTRKATIVNKTSPAKIFPNKRKAKERTLENSERISRIPTKNIIGLEKLKNL